MNNTFNLSRFGKFFAMELRLFRNIILILLALTMIEMVWSMANFSETHRQLIEAQQVLADLDEEEIGDLRLFNANVSTSDSDGLVSRAIESAKLGVNPFRMGGAFGLLLILLPFFLYTFVYHPTKSLTYTTLPASTLEKFTSAWVMCVVAVPVLTFVVSLLTAFIGDLAGAQVSYHSLALKYFFRWVYLPTIATQSFFFWAVFWFKRRKAQKAVLIIAILVIALALLMFPHNNSILWSEFIRNPNQTLIYCIVYGLTVLFWTVALVKYRRTQI